MPLRSLSKVFLLFPAAVGEGGGGGGAKNALLGPGTPSLPLSNAN